MRNVIDVIIKEMYEGIEDDKADRHYAASCDIDKVMSRQGVDIDERLKLIREIDSYAVRELLYEYHIGNLSRDLFYEKSKEVKY